MRARYLSRVYSCSDYDALFLRSELSWLIFIRKKMLVLKFFRSVGDPFFGGDGEKVDGSSFEGSNDV